MSSTPDGFRNAPTTRGGFMLVSLYSWMCITWMALIMRLTLGVVIHRVGFQRDDATALVGSIFYLGVVVSGQYAVNGGLGKDFSDVNGEDAVLLFKALYIAKLLSVVAAGFGKLSFAFLIARVVPQTKKAKTVLFGIIGAWSMFSMFATAFQCGVPKAWNVESVFCNDSGMLLAVVMLNIISDLVLTAWILPTLKALALDRTSYWTATVLFGCRALVPIASCLQIWVVAQGRSDSDLGKHAVDVAVISHAVTSLSLITASIPRIKRSLGIGGSGILYPCIHETELSASQRGVSRLSTTDTESRLVPSGNSKFSVAITSKGNKSKTTTPHTNWQHLVSMGSKEDEHTSTSSLFDRNEHGGVMIHQDFTIEVEEGSPSSAH
ncbi:hypothetical protein P153DRAFT_343683 [Dothidotthia symphoricarpi CBS 119687]|uniref:Rhodopsin domain-containing protein n=1 Tax=Dothidotthia symphoricarpi CBS 119687 TaxID=1392245 RepID=A0A6A6A8X0_9PLEO|nr:uncharacterized protein P153DRAFT_343683 [Dothidotthia symphoricarpi CBS 119687]KAF2127534.1 hypothetical protein P153DRAFT_343683 [Dothidotthia symphoricarpi CBS 119687]